MIQKIKNKITKIRRSLGFFTIDEVLHVVINIGHCKDRDDFEWKLKEKLRGMK